MARRSRTNQRGAAMVEAAVVMPVLVTFLGMMIWFHNIYKVKQDVMYQARTEALTYASRACQNSPPPPDNSANPSLNNGDAQQAQQQGPLASAMSMAFQLKPVRRTLTTQGGHKIASGWSKTLEHNSVVMCNERRLDNGLLDLIPFVVGIVQSGRFF